MVQRINPRTGKLEEEEELVVPQPINQPIPTSQPSVSPWSKLKPSSWEYNNPGLGIEKGVLNPNAMTRTPIPADAPYQVPQTQLSFTQQHPLLNALGGAAAGFIGNAVRPGSTWASALLSAGGGAAKNIITRNDEITKLRNDMLTKLQENRVKNNQALQLGQTAKDIGLPGYKNGGYYLGSQSDLTSQAGLYAGSGKPDAEGNFDVTPSESNINRKEQINKAMADYEDIRNQLIPLMSQPETPQIKATKDTLLMKLNKLGRLTGKGSVSLEDVQKFLKSQAETTKSQVEAKWADRQQEEASANRQQNLRQGEVAIDNAKLEQGLKQIQAKYADTFEQAKLGDAQAKQQLNQMKLEATNTLRSLGNNVTGQNAVKAYEAWNILNDYQNMRNMGGILKDVNPYAAERNKFLNPVKKIVTQTPPPENKGLFGFMEELFPPATSITNKPRLGR